MTPDEYVKNAVRTESPADKVLERIKQENFTPMSKFVCDLPKIVETLAELDKWKKHMFYGKPLGLDRPIMSKQMFLDLDPKFIRLLHGSMGIATEAGELLEALQKVLNRPDQNNNSSNVDMVNLAEEIGDVMWYTAILCDTLEIDLGAVMEKNIAKLKARYPNKFTEEHAINRDLETERKILEK